MTNLEAFLIIVIWVGYGAFGSYQSRHNINFDSIWGTSLFIIFAPILFIVRALYGAFKTYK